MPTITVRLNEEEQKTLNVYAELHGMPLSTLFMQMLERHMKDDIDLEYIKKYEPDLKNVMTKTYNH